MVAKKYGDVRPNERSRSDAAKQRRAYAFLTDDVLTPELESCTERLFMRSRYRDYPVFFQHARRSYRLECDSCFGKVIVASVVLVNNYSGNALLRISKSGEAVFQEATR